ncbi:alpha/beta fold hydrolase [Litorivicinus lipolyticus]|uniref:Alpha/beta fold hydrolase n=1 Tax=Litorivicinus lipolyticus TaxID=418701 RepID=A0A5Q2Q5G5_9GAMM|nr:alpha/beta fold hydrolase [Litorivicinus lipolyticus]QGG79219.1 alpha/beta fold hydrolase [Litorivicinus lipolyticus]
MSFRPAWWLANPHLQSIIPTRLRRIDLPGRARAIVRTRDQDELLVEQLDTGNGPLVILLHGLGGCASSLYVTGMQSAFHQAGYNTWAWNARGAVRPNLRPDTYHGGRFADVADLVDSAGQRPVALVGFSLGAAMLINLVGRPAACPSTVKAAVAISCPFGFVKNAAHLDGPSTWLYRRYLLGRLRRMTQRKRNWAVSQGLDWARRLPDDAELARLTRFADFDDRITAPLNGFADATDLYRQVDPDQVVSAIQTPTLVVQADDDPLFTAPLEPTGIRPKSLTLELTSGGGHVGFVQGRWPWSAEFYAQTRALEFVRAQMERT